MSYKFTVAIPAFKDLYLDEAISSVLQQTYKNFEVVILNDNSPYDIDSIVDRYKDERLRYFKNKINIGAYNIVSNWNHCLDLATGDYIIMMGDDDRLESNCLEEYSHLIDIYPNLNVYHGRTIIIDEKSKFVMMHEARPDLESMRSLIWHRLLGRQQYIGDFLYRTSWLRGAGGYYNLPLAWGSDDITAILAAKDNGIANTNMPIFNYRVNSSSISMNTYLEQKLDCNVRYNQIILEIIKKTKPIDATDALYDKMIIQKLPRKLLLKDAHLFAISLKTKGFLRTLMSFLRLKHKFKLPMFVYAVAIIDFMKGKM